MIKPQKGRNLVTHANKTLCQLYGTLVADIESTSKDWSRKDQTKHCAVFRHGGWVTRATCKAINAALESHGLASWHCFIKDGVMYVSPGSGLEPIDVFHS